MRKYFKIRKLKDISIFNYTLLYISNSVIIKERQGIRPRN